MSPRQVAMIIYRAKVNRVLHYLDPGKMPVDGSKLYQLVEMNGLQLRAIEDCPTTFRGEATTVGEVASMMRAMGFDL